MKFSFKNIKEDSITIYIEPSTDQFVLNTDSTIEIHSPEQDENLEFQFDYVDDGIVIWMPSGSSAIINIDGEKVDSLYESFAW